MVGERIATIGPTGSHPSPVWTIDHTAYPHIVDSILRNTDFRTLATWRSLSRAFKERAEAQLRVHIVVDSEGQIRYADGGVVRPAWFNAESFRRAIRVVDLTSAGPSAVRIPPCVQKLADVAVVRECDALDRSPQMHPPCNTLHVFIRPASSSSVAPPQGAVVRGSTGFIHWTQGLMAFTGADRPSRLVVNIAYSAGTPWVGPWHPIIKNHRNTTVIFGGEIVLLFTPTAPAESTSLPIEGEAQPALPEEQHARRRLSTMVHKCTAVDIARALAIWIHQAHFHFGDLTRFTVVGASGFHGRDFRDEVCSFTALLRRFLADHLSITAASGSDMPDVAELRAAGMGAYRTACDVVERVVRFAEIEEYRSEVGDEQWALETVFEPPEQKES